MECTDRNGDRWQICRSDGWRWTRTARSGVTVGASSESYSNRSDCIANARRHAMT